VAEVKGLLSAEHFFVDQTIIAILGGTAPSDNRFPMVQRSEGRALATPMNAPIGGGKSGSDLSVGFNAD
jgi:hypothetical protein